MRINLLLCIQLLLIPFSGMSQSNADNRNFPHNSSIVWRAQVTAPIGIHLAGSAEMALLPKLTIHTQAGIISALGFEKESNSPNLGNISTVGFFSVEARRYLNFYHRHKNKKSIRDFSGNYLALRYFSSTPPFKQSNQSINFESTNSLQVHYGFQRAIKKQLFWGGHIGFAVADAFKENSKNSPVGGFPLLQFGLSFGYTFK
jgi:hypothetical protein